MKNQDHQKEPDIGLAPDVDSSSDEYAKRFSGKAGEWLIAVQSQITEQHVSKVGAAHILDVGGGHAQNVEPIESRGIQLTISGSSVECGQRVERYKTLPSTQFVCSSLMSLDFEAGAFSHLISYRIVSHMEDWRAFVGELCRVSDDAVTIDFATKRSINFFSELAFKIKKGQEGDTRRYHVLSESDVDAVFATHGFSKVLRTPQFFWPMAIHRKMGNPSVSSALEFLPRLFKLTAGFGSPVIATYRRKM